MAIDKALNQAPLGLDHNMQEDPNAQPLEIEIEDPEAVHIGIGDTQIDIEPAVDEDEFNKN